MKTYIKVSVNKTIEQDTYQEGCLPSTFQDYGYIKHFTFDSMDEAKEKLESYYGKFEVDELNNALIYSRLEDGNGYEIGDNDKKLELWKEGKEDLYLANYYFFFKEITEKEIEESSLTPFFVNV
jgi:hypothetical protein